MPNNPKQCPAMPSTNKSLYTSKTIIDNCFKMPDNDPNFEENVKKAFKFVKDDVNLIKSEIKGLKESVLKIVEKLDLKSLNKDNNNQYSYKNDELDLFIKKSSIRNDGVKNNQQQSTINNNPKQSSTNDPQPITEDLKKVLDTIINKTQNLSDREFSIFIKIYDLGLNQAATYPNLAKEFNLTESTVRGAVKGLITRGIPIQKERFFNKESSLFIPEELNNPYIIQRIIKARQKKYVQKTLFDL